MGLLRAWVLFSATFRYALIGLLEIARAEQGIKAAEIAERHSISGRYLANVLNELRRLGLVTSQKGRHGGYQLARQPEQIDLLEIHQGLAGSADHEARVIPSGAEAWLLSLETRWRAELAATSLEELRRAVETECCP